MNTKKSLQKLTKNDARLNEILQQKKITPKDIENLSKVDAERLMELTNERIRNLSGVELDQFYTKIEPLLAQSSKNEMWERNHIQITRTISFLMQEYGRMPTQTEIAIKAELSRQTVHKHLKEYTKHPQHIEQMEQFRFMASKVLATVFQFAVNGDTGAAKLYLNATGFLNNRQSTGSTLIQSQNNYIQINGMVLSQEKIKHLTPDQLNTIETILKAALLETKMEK